FDGLKVLERDPFEHGHLRAEAGHEQVAGDLPQVWEILGGEVCGPAQEVQISPYLSAIFVRVDVGLRPYREGTADLELAAVAGEPGGALTREGVDSVLAGAAV